VIILVVLIFLLNPNISFSENAFDELLESAINKTKSGDFHDAIKDFDLILELEPKNLKALNGKGAALLQSNQQNEALSYFNKVLENDPDHVPALTNKAIILSENNQVEEALELFDKALENDPDNIQALINKASVVGVDKQEKEEAIKLLDIVLTIDPDNKIASENKNSFVKSFELYRIDGHVQTVVRDKNGSLIAYLETDRIKMSSYSKMNSILVQVSDSYQTLTRDGIEYYNFGSLLPVVVPDNVMQAGVGWITTINKPQNAEIQFESVKARQHGWMSLEDDKVVSLWQLIIPK